MRGMRRLGVDRATAEWECGVAWKVAEDCSCCPVTMPAVKAFSAGK
jgi:hypothetical protein